jgi:hypothetical protein
VLGGAVGLILVLTLGAELGERPGANAAWVVLDRSLDAFSRQAWMATPRALERALSLVPLVLGAAVLALPGRRPEFRAALSLCLLGRAGSGTPAAALLSVGGALLVVTLALEPHPTPEHLERKPPE